MKRIIPYLAIVSVIVNVIFIVLFLIDKESEREEKRRILSEYVDNQKIISNNVHQIVLELTLSKKEIPPESDDYKFIFYILKETEELLEINEELYLLNMDKEIFPQSIRSIHMQGLAVMPMVWNRFLDGEISDELSNLEKYNTLLKNFFDELNGEHNFQNVHQLKEMIKILEEVTISISQS